MVHMVNPTTKGRLARARELRDMVPYFGEVMWQAKYDDTVRALYEDHQIAAWQACWTAASLALDGMPATWPRTKRKRS